MDLEKLKNRDYYLLIDKSGSMSTNDCAQGKTRWATAQEATENIARKLNEFDPDGISVVPFASNFKAYDNTTPDRVHTIFTENEPNGGTNLARQAQAASHLRRLQRSEHAQGRLGTQRSALHGSHQDENGRLR